MTQHYYSKKNAIQVTSLRLPTGAFWLDKRHTSGFAHGGTVLQALLAALIRFLILCIPPPQCCLFHLHQNLLLLHQQVDGVVRSHLIHTTQGPLRDTGLCLQGVTQLRNRDTEYECKVKFAEVKVGCRCLGSCRRAEYHHRVLGFRKSFVLYFNCCSIISSFQMSHSCFFRDLCHCTAIGTQFFSNGVVRYASKIHAGW